MRCHSFRRRGFHSSLRGRLARAFVAVALGTVLVTFVALHAGVFGNVGHRPDMFRMLFLAIPVAGAAGAFTATLIIRRLTRLRDAVERLNAKDLSVRVPVEGNDEIAVLARAFNRMADRLEAEERVRRELFADVAHELRHPLAVLQGRLELMQDGVVPLEPEQVLHLQDMVLTLTRLVGDVRDLSLAEVGRLSLHPVPLDVAALIAELCENMEPVAAHRGIALLAQVDPALPVLTADPDRIRQVLVNLVANALHYTPQGGRVAVRAWCDGDQIAICVSDTGPGINPQDLPQIFDRFYRTDKSRARVSGGSGLGLAIVRSLITLHGGTVRAESPPGQGSRFTVTLPVKADG